MSRLNRSVFSSATLGLVALIFAFAPQQAEAFTHDDVRQLYFKVREANQSFLHTSLSYLQAAGVLAPQPGSIHAAALRHPDLHVQLAGNLLASKGLIPFEPTPDCTEELALENAKKAIQGNTFGSGGPDSSRLVQSKVLEDSYRFRFKAGGFLSSSDPFEFFMSKETCGLLKVTRKSGWSGTVKDSTEYFQ